MQEYTTTHARRARRAPGNVSEAGSRLCEYCGMPLRPGMRAHARYCCPSCRAAAFDERHERGSHRKGGENG